MLLAVKLLEVPLQIAAGPFTVIVGVAVTVTLTVPVALVQPAIIPDTVYTVVPLAVGVAVTLPLVVLFK